MHDIVTDLSPERLAAVYAALPREARDALDGPVAQVLRSRVASVRRRPVETRVRALRALLQRTRDGNLAAELLGAYLLGPCKTLVTGFLDATGVAHEDGRIDGPAGPDGARVPEAVAAALEQHDREDVLLYLRVAQRQWPEIPELGTAIATLTASASGAGAGAAAGAAD